MTLEEKIAQLHSYRSMDTLLFDPDWNFTGGNDTEILNRGVGSFFSPAFFDPPSQRRSISRINSFQKYMIEKTRLGMAAIFGFQGRGETIGENHVAVTLKHFAGHGQSEGGRNLAPVNHSERYFRETHLYPFEMAVKKANAQSIISSLWIQT